MKTPETKKCSCCRRELPYSEFYFLAHRMQYSCYCKECHSEKAKKYYRSLKSSTLTMSCRHFTADEINYLQRNYLSQTAAEIAAALHRSALSIYRKAYSLGLRKITPHKNNH